MRSMKNDLERLLEIDYRSSWDELEQVGMDIQMNYQEGEFLLATNWHQSDPYNDLCPTGDTGCVDCCPSDPWICAPTAPTLVGCVATAGSQIMKYWSWPPYGSLSSFYVWYGDYSCNLLPVGGGVLSATYSDTYDWVNMANEYNWDAGQARWEDENGNPLNAIHLAAVQELCYEVGVAVEMGYGVCASGANTAAMLTVYENQYRYSTDCNIRYRSDYTAVEWFERMKSQFNENRPIHYRVEAHSIVSDGWQETGAGPLREYHMNYGWADNATTWYTLDALLFGGIAEEYMLENIYPAQAIGSLMAGSYLKQEFNYRCFDQDTEGMSAVFQAGQLLQAISGVTISSTNSSGASVEFNGEPDNITALYSKDAPDKGIRVHNGKIKLSNGGGITLR